MTLFLSEWIAWESELANGACLVSETVEVGGAHEYVGTAAAVEAAQAASIGGGTEGAGEGFSDELKQGLNQIYNVYIWAQLDVLEDMWRNASAEVHAQMPKQMLVVRDAAKVYAADVQNEEQ
ncbi:Protein of unknown function [Gryllus bimaculatus]|nr:Protein of unknown function [Gryllus bimaculatus]